MTSSSGTKLAVGAYLTFEAAFAAWLIWELPSFAAVIVVGFVITTAIAAEGWKVALRRGAGASVEKKK